MALGLEWPHAAITLLVLSVSALILLALALDDWLRIWAGPPFEVHVLHAMMGARTLEVHVTFLPDPCAHWLPVPAPLRATGMDYGDHGGCRFAGTSITRVCRAGAVLTMFGAFLNSANCAFCTSSSCRKRILHKCCCRIYLVVAMLIWGGTLYAASCCTGDVLRDCIFDILSSLPIGTTVTVPLPAHLAIDIGASVYALLAGGSIAFILGVLSYGSSLREDSTLLAEERGAATLAVWHKQRAEVDVLHAELRSETASARQDLLQEHRRTADAALFSSVPLFVLLLLSSLTLLGKRASDQGLQNALHRPRTSLNVKPGDGRRQLRAAALRTSIRTAVRLDGLRKALLFRVLGKVPQEPSLPPPMYGRTLARAQGQ